MVQTRNAVVREDIKRIPLFKVASEEDLSSPLDRRSESYRHTASKMAGYKHPIMPIPEKMLTIPTVLTLLRLFLVPVFVASWYTIHQYASIATAIIFIAASLTDWLDGYLARRMKLTTAFGSFLDPVADKIMVCTALIMLAIQPPRPISPQAMTCCVLIMIGRELSMSALREWAASSGSGAHGAVKVNSLGKWKTALQMVSMSCLLVFRNGEDLVGGDDAEVVKALHIATEVAFVFLLVAALLAVISLVNYMKGVWRFFRYPGGKAR